MKEQKLRSQPCEKDVMRIAYDRFYAHVHIIMEGMSDRPSVA